MTTAFKRQQECCAGGLHHLEAGRYCRPRLLTIHAIVSALGACLCEMVAQGCAFHTMGSQPVQPFVQSCSHPLLLSITSNEAWTRQLPRWSLICGGSAVQCSVSASCRFYLDRLPDSPEPGRSLPRSPTSCIFSLLLSRSLPAWTASYAWHSSDLTLHSNQLFAPFLQVAEVPRMCYQWPHDSVTRQISCCLV